MFSRFFLVRLQVKLRLGQCSSCGSEELTVKTATASVWLASQP
jgi:Fe-S cluster biogenesis protein NfuA